MPRGSSIFVDDFKELVDSCICFSEENKDRMGLERIQERRDDLSGFAEVFHKDCGTLTSSVHKRIRDLKTGGGVVLMTAHQPNFFAYSGVLRKATLNFVLAEKIEDQLEVPVVSFFGIADQDFTDDRWVRSCQLPAVKRSGGVLSLDVKLPEKLMFNTVGGPSSDLVKKWESEIEVWLTQTISSVKRLCGDQCSEGFLSSSAGVLQGNFEFFWDVVEDCYRRSERYSDFNGFLMSKIVNNVWAYDTVFARFSECQQAFVDEFCFLLSRSKDYSRLLVEAKQIPSGEVSGGGVSDEEPGLAPFWYHCDCGSKVKLGLVEEDGFLFGKGSCVGCGERYSLEFGREEDPELLEVADRISARAIPMGLVFFNGLVPSCYVGGVGGIQYLMEAEHVATGLGIPFPSVAVWRPHDKYLGVGQVEAVLELKRICRDYGVEGLSAAKNLLKTRIREVRERLDQLEDEKKDVIEKLRMQFNDEQLKEEIKRISMSQTSIKKSSNLSVIIHELKILENVSTVLNLIPSIIDYAVNVGLKETSDQWIRFLDEDGSLSSDVYIESALNLGELNSEFDFGR
jgi:hypothetical protein